jgi:hypothetical protein
MGMDSWNTYVLRLPLPSSYASKRELIAETPAFGALFDDPGNIAVGVFSEGDQPTCPYSVDFSLSNDDSSMWT